MQVFDVVSAENVEVVHPRAAGRLKNVAPGDPVARRDDELERVGLVELEKRILIANVLQLRATMVEIGLGRQIYLLRVLVNGIQARRYGAEPFRRRRRHNMFPRRPLKRDAIERVLKLKRDRDCDAVYGAGGHTSGNQYISSDDGIPIESFRFRSFPCSE